MKLIGWSLVAALGLVPALLWWGLVLSVVGAPIAWLIVHFFPTKDDHDDEPTPAGHRRAAWALGALVGLAELGILPGLCALFHAPIPWAPSIGAALGAWVCWALVYARIPPYAGFKITPAVIAACAGAGLGALLGGFAELG